MHQDVMHRLLPEAVWMKWSGPNAQRWRQHPLQAHDQARILLQIKPWKLEQGDTALLDLIPFLEAVMKNNVADVRSVIKSYEGQDIPTAYR